MRARVDGARLLLLLAAAAAVAAPAPAAAAGAWPRAAWPWPHPDPASGKERLSTEWERTLGVLWGRSHEKVGFCIGNSQRKAQSDDPADALCSNRSRIDAHLCTPPEIEQFYKFMLLTENPEKIPDNQHCIAGAEGQPACSPGFFDERMENRPAPVAPQRAHACCEGYFCPPQLTCMLPCPLGSYCPRAQPAQPPDRYRAHGNAQWCAPYAYKERVDLGCGGADKWRIVPGGAFPTAHWSAGSGSIYCDGGHFCPNTTAMLSCKAGHFCRQGSTEPSRCPPGVACPERTEMPDQNYTGITVDAMLFGVLWLAWLISRQYNRVLLRLSKRERIKITWGSHGQPKIVTVVKIHTGSSTVGSTPHSRSQSRTYSHSRSHSLQLGQGQGQGQAHHGGSEPQDERGSGDGSSASGVRPKSSSLLGFGQRHGALRTHSGGSGRKGRAGQVWAAWSGPDAEADGAGYEALPEDQPSPLPAVMPPPLLHQPQQLHQRRHSTGAAADGGGSGENTASGGGGEALEMSPPHRPLAAAKAGHHAAHARNISIDYEGELTPRGLHSLLVAQHRQSLLASPLSSVHTGAGARKAPLRIEFQELGLRLKSCGKTVLAGVTGMLAESKVTAIMGPSGAGKTTLLNALAGKAQAYGLQTGTVLVNGRPDKLERYKRVMGFVPQDDIMHSTLSVYENLLFSARFRLPAHYTREQHLFFVERAISVLQLEDVRDELVGDEETRGISGGQKKRVNVGLELVADPSLLFLDEPTSGLDSSSSKALVAALQEVVQSGVTAAAVIHQPSWQTCLLFDDLLLLGRGKGKGGRTVYYGPVQEMQGYFERLGFEFPLQQNPVDSCMDIVSGAVMREGQVQVSAAELFDAWDDHCGRPRCPSPGLQDAAGSCDDLPASSGAHAGASMAGEQPPAPALLLAPHLRQLGSSDRLLALEDGAAEAHTALLGDAEEQRSWKRRVREAIILACAYVAAGAGDAWHAVRGSLPQADGTHLGRWLFARRKRAAPSASGLSDADYSSPGVNGGRRSSSRLDAQRNTPGFLPQYVWSLGRAMLKRSRQPLAVFTDYAIIALTGMTLGLISDRGRETIMHFAVSITYSVVALGLMSTVGALGTFGSDRVVFFREAASGLNRLSHFLALETFDHLGTVMRSAIYFIMYYSFASPRAVIWQMLLVSMAITYCCTGIAYVLSQVMEPSAAQLSAAVLALINTLIARQGHARGLVKLAQTFSFARWGLEGYVISESNKLTGVWLLARCADLQGLEYDVRRFGLCLLALFGLGLLFRAIALLAMFILHRDKQR